MKHHSPVWLTSPALASAPIPSVLPTNIPASEPTCSAQGQGLHFPDIFFFSHYMVAEFNEAGASPVSSSTTKMLKIWTFYEQQHHPSIAVWLAARHSSLFFFGIPLQSVLGADKGHNCFISCLSLPLLAHALCGPLCHFYSDF